VRTTDFQNRGPCQASLPLSLFGIAKMVSCLTTLFTAAVAVVAAAAETIPAAELVSSKPHILPGSLRVTELVFKVPLDYSDPDGEKIELFARTVTNYVKPIVPSDDEGDDSADDLPYMVYLEGGPGFGNREPQNHVLTSDALERGYKLLLIDHRGTGLSTPVSTKMLQQLDGGEDAQVSYLRLMRQDNTVRDCEAVRKLLLKDKSDNEAKWSIFGQSYGGFIALSYLSFHPEGLREVFLTGGLAPVGKTADDVYEGLYPRIIQRSVDHYNKFPEDVKNVRQIASYIEKQGGSVDMPGGGKLTVPFLMTIGIDFGVNGALDLVHSNIINMKRSLDQFGFLSRASLQPLEVLFGCNDNIIYAILHEAIYCDGPGSVSAWASDRVAKKLDLYSWLNPNSTISSNSSEPLLFASENVFPFFFDTYPELIPLKSVANKLAAIDDWEPLYDQKQLAKNTVPVYAASYINDLYVDYDIAKQTAKMIKGIKTFETNAFIHSGLRTNTADVLGALWKLRDDVTDY
jgi:pimeloyl-ACP methyl ester carboxylesterase